MTLKPVYDLVATNREGESVGYFIYARHQSPLSVVARKPQLTGAVLDRPTDAGGTYSVRDQDQPALCVADWSKGAGQKSYEVEGAETAKFHSSSAIDTARKGELRLAKASALTAASTSTGIVFSALGTVFQSYTGPLVKGWDGSAFDTIGLTGPTAQVLCFATDGQYLYASFGVDGIYRVKEEHGNANWDDETLALWCNPSESIVKMAYSGGYMYGATTSAVGYFDDTPAFNQLSQAVLNPVVSTFGLATAGNWVYWGTSKEGITKLYRVQFDGTNEWVEDVCDFPKGFVATSMAGYLGHVFVGGYYECATTNAGQGALYMVSEGTPNLLATIGENPDYSADPSSLDNDNRIWDLFPYGKDLYILATRRVLRWDLDDGGWVPVMTVPQGTSSSMTWVTTDDSDYDASVTEAAPASPWEVSGSGTTVVAYSDPSLLVSCPAGTGAASKVYTNTSISSLASATGTTLEVTVPAYSIQGAVAKAVQTFGIDDGTHSVFFKVYKQDTRNLCIERTSYWDDGTKDTATTAISVADPHTYRMTLASGVARIYCDGNYIGTITNPPASTDERVYFGTDFSASVVLSRSYVDSVKVAANGAFAPGAEYGPSTIGTIAALDNKFFVGISSIGYVTSASTYETSGWLRLSTSAAKSGSLQKTYHSIIIDHDALAAPEGISVDYILDHSPTMLSATVSDQSDPRRTVFSVDRPGHSIAPIITLTGDGTSTPVVRGVTVTYDFKRYLTHTYILDCRRQAGDGRWDEDPEDAINHLVDMASVGGTFESRFGGSFTGVVQELEFLEANRSRQGGIEGILSVAVRELE